MKKQLIFLFFISISATVFSQVHGFIKDSSGRIVPGAHVRWLGAESGVVSDERGHFHISASNSTNLLIFSGVGYSSDTLDISGLNTKDHLNIVLNDNIELDDVIVTQRRSGKMVTGFRSKIWKP